MSRKMLTINTERRRRMKIYDYNGRKNLCGEKIRLERIRKKLSQSDLAARLQVRGIIIERDSISRIESGTRFVADYELKAFAEIFAVDVNELLDT